MQHILIIDDDSSLRAILRAGLEEDGHWVEEAGDGVEGLRKLRLRSADVVLCDLFMPGQDGLATLMALKQEFPGLPVVTMSGGGFDGRLDLLPVAMRLGAREALHKPFSRQALREALARAAPGRAATSEEPTGPPPRGM